VREIMGTEEIKKVIDYIEDCIVKGLEIDWTKVKAELEELDASEKTDILTTIAKKILKGLLVVIGE
jgi:uncharacterized protein YpuA (DUF1002 family)